jgi:hypothetical protein
MKKVIARKYSENKLELNVVNSNYNFNNIDELITSLQRIKEEGYSELTLSLKNIEYEGTHEFLESVTVVFEGHVAIFESDEQYTDRLTKEKYEA